MENSSCWPRLDRRAAYAMRPMTLFGCMLASAVNLKFLSCAPQTRVGTSNSKTALES
jgi:hypothetical protein